MRETLLSLIMKLVSLHKKCKLEVNFDGSGSFTGVKWSVTVNDNPTPEHFS